MDTLPEDVLHSIIDFSSKQETKLLALVSRYLRATVIASGRFIINCDDSHDYFFVQRLQHALTHNIPVRLFCFQSPPSAVVSECLPQVAHLIVELFVHWNLFQPVHPFLSVPVPRLRKLYTSIHGSSGFDVIPPNLFQGLAPRLTNVRLSSVSTGDDPIAAFQNVQHLQLRYGNRTPHIDIKRHFPSISTFLVSYTPDRSSSFEPPNFNVDFSGVESRLHLKLMWCDPLLSLSEDLIQQLSKVGLISSIQEDAYNDWLWAGISGSVSFHAGYHAGSILSVRGEHGRQRNLELINKRSAIPYATIRFAATLVYFRIHSNLLFTTIWDWASALPALETIHIDYVYSDYSFFVRQNPVTQCNRLRTLNIASDFHDTILADGVAGIAHLLGQSSRASDDFPELNLYSLTFEGDPNILETVFSSVTLHMETESFPTPRDLSASWDWNKVK